MALAEVLVVIGAILGPILTVVPLYINRLRERDKLQHDQEMSAVKQEMVTVKATVVRCESDCKACLDTALVDRDRREIAELRGARLEGELAALSRDNRELQDENRELRERLIGGGSASSH